MFIIMTRQIMHKSCIDRFSGDGIRNVLVAAHVQNAESLMRAPL
jgi:hypothetical protein